MLALRDLTWTNCVEIEEISSFWTMLFTIDNIANDDGLYSRLKFFSSSTLTLKNCILH